MGGFKGFFCFFVGLLVYYYYGPAVWCVLSLNIQEGSSDCCDWLSFVFVS